MKKTPNFYSTPLILSNFFLFLSLILPLFMLLLKKRERKTNTKGIQENLNSVPVLENKTMLCCFKLSFSEELNFPVIFHAGIILWSKDCNQKEVEKEKQLFCESSQRLLESLQRAADHQRASEGSHCTNIGALKSLQLS